MVYAGTAWTAGLLVMEFCGFVPAVLAAMACAFVLKLLRFEWKGILLMMTVFVVAIGFYKAYDALVYRRITAFDGKEISFSGTVTDFRDYSDDNSVYFIDGEINGKTNAKIMVYTDSAECEPGDKMNFSCIAEIPHDDFLFNSRSYYRSKGIYLLSYSVENMTIDKPHFSLRKLLFRFREKVISVIENSVPEAEGAMLKAMLFGDKSDMYADDMTMLYRTGIGHVTAVSGLHLVLFCTMISFLMNKISAGKLTSFLVSEVFMLLFAVCCGMSVSVLRAFFMMTLVNLAPLFFRYTDSFNSVCIAAVLLTLSNPFVIANQSFLLSVSGALGAGAFAPYMTAKMRTDTFFRRFMKNAAYLLCVSLAVTPMSVVCFGELSIVSPISNLLITPVCMTAILIAMTASMVIFMEPHLLFKLAGVICRAVLNISRTIGSNRFSYANTYGEYVPTVVIILVILIILSYMIFGHRKYCVISILLSAAIFFTSSAFISVTSGRILRIALLGKGETGVIVVVKGNAVDVIDMTGKAENSRYAAKYLEELGLFGVNNLLLTVKPYSSAASYDSQLGLYSVENMVVPGETHFRHDIKICNCKPKYSDFMPWVTDYGEYSISVEENVICVDFGEYHFECINGGNGQIQYKPNTELRVSESGKFDFRRLENG